MKNSELDAYDIKILNVLRTDGRIPITELAPRVGLSKTPCKVRIDKLTKSGVIKGFAVVLDQQKLGRDHVAFAEIKLGDTREKALQEFNAAVRSVPEIEQCHMIAGPFDYLVKVRTKDIHAYRKVLGERISTLPHVTSSSTYVAMESVVDTTV